MTPCDKRIPRIACLLSYGYLIISSLDGDGKVFDEKIGLLEPDDVFLRALRSRCVGLSAVRMKLLGKTKDFYHSHGGCVIRHGIGNGGYVSV